MSAGKANSALAEALTAAEAPVLPPAPAEAGSRRQRPGTFPTDRARLRRRCEAAGGRRGLPGQRRGRHGALPARPPRSWPSDARRKASSATRKSWRRAGGYQAMARSHRRGPDDGGAVRAGHRVVQGRGIVEVGRRARRRCADAARTRLRLAGRPRTRERPSSASWTSSRSRRTPPPAEAEGTGRSRAVPRPSARRTGSR